VVPSIVLTTSHAVQAYTSDHRVLLLGLLRAMVAFWPLLPVVAGTTLLRNALTDKVKALPTRAKYFQNEGTACRFGCPSFDV
jgi:hypothetical protein